MMIPCNIKSRAARYDERMYGSHCQSMDDLAKISESISATTVGLKSAITVVCMQACVNSKARCSSRENHKRKPACPGQRQKTRGAHKAKGERRHMFTALQKLVCSACHKAVPSSTQICDLGWKCSHVVYAYLLGTGTEVAQCSALGPQRQHYILDACLCPAHHESRKGGSTESARHTC